MLFVLFVYVDIGRYRALTLDTPVLMYCKKHDPTIVVNCVETANTNKCGWKMGANIIILYTEKVIYHTIR